MTWKGKGNWNKLHPNEFSEIAARPPEFHSIWEAECWTHPLHEARAAGNSISDFTVGSWASPLALLSHSACSDSSLYPTLWPKKEFQLAHRLLKKSSSIILYRVSGDQGCISSSQGAWETKGKSQYGGGKGMGKNKYRASKRLLL